MEMFRRLNAFHFAIKKLRLQFTESVLLNFSTPRRCWRGSECRGGAGCQTASKTQKVDCWRLKRMTTWFLLRLLAVTIFSLFVCQVVRK